jgi:hypothetical protein
MFDANKRLLFLEVAKLAASSGTSFQPTVDCTSYLHAARIIEAGYAGAVLPDLALPFFDAAEFHSLRLPETFNLCLVWSGRNASTRTALVELIECLGDVLKAKKILKVG